MSRRLRTCVVCLCLATWSALGAQEAPRPEPAKEAIEAQIAALSAETSAVPAADRDKAIGLYRQALEQLKKAEEEAGRAAEHLQLIAEAPAATDRLKAELSLPFEKPKVVLPEQADLPALEQLLSEAVAQLALARKDLSTADAVPGQRAQRRQIVAEQKVELQKQLEGLRAPEVAVEGESAEVHAARLAATAAQAKAVAAQLDAMDKELRRYDARNELIQLTVQKAQRDVRRLEALVEAWQVQVNDERQRQAEETARLAREARVALERDYPSLGELAKGNTRLAEERTRAIADAPSVLDQRADYATRLADSQRRLTTVRESLNSTRDRLQSAERLDGLARKLVSDRAKLPDLRAERGSQRDLRPVILRAQRRQVELEDELASLRDLDRSAEDILHELGASAHHARHDELEAATRKMLQERQQLLSQLATDYNVLLDTLFELVAVKHELVTLTGTYIDLITEKLVWIRSDPPLQLSDLSRAWDGVKSLLDADSWKGLLSSLGRGLQRSPVRVAVGALLIVALLLLRLPLRQRLRSYHEQVRNWRTDSIHYTFRGLVIVVALALIVPVTLWVLAWWITELPAPASVTRQSEAANGFAESVAFGLENVARFVLGLALVRWLIRPGGLCEVHLRWPGELLAPIDRYLKLLLFIGVVPAFLFVAMQKQTLELHSTMLVRVTFVLLLAVLAVTLAIVLWPSRTLSRGLLKLAPAWVQRLPLLPYVLIIGAAVAQAVLAAEGFTYTALHILDGLWNTLQLAVGLILVRGLAMRWLLLARRKLALEQARRRQEQHEAVAAATDAERLQQNVQAESEIGRAVSLAALDQRTRALVKGLVNIAFVLGCWWIWTDLLPALRVLDEKVLWEDVTVVDQGSIITPITVANLLSCLLILVVTALAASGLPAFLEMVILGRLPMSQGARYALMTLLRYVLVAVGVIMAFSAIEIGWSKVQWLIAAMGVGLGFGLQEIFANFVSGIVLLFERPMRVGDMVTVGDVTGRVSRIEMRATTIVDWDRRELVVPNKEFITGRLINWTLTDSIIRLVVPIGVAHGTDLALTQNLLLEAAHEEEHVLDDPEPLSFVLRFTPSTTDFELRVFLPNPDLMPVVRHSLLERIQKKFAAHGIAFAVPQLEVHMRSSPAEVYASGQTV